MTEEPPHSSIVAVGQITRTHGVRGEVYVRDDSDNPDRFAPKQRFTTSTPEFPTLVTREVRPGPHGLIVEFAGITTIEEAERLVGADLFIPIHERRALDDHEYWPDQLVGLEVRDADGTVGVVDEVLLGPQDRLVVRRDDGSLGEIPFVEPLVPEVDMAAGWIRVDLPDGLFSPR